jgi:hypothetical protein
MKIIEVNGGPAAAITTVLLGITNKLLICIWHCGKKDVD